MDGLRISNLDKCVHVVCSNRRVNNEQVLSFARALSTNTSVRSVNLSCNCIDDSGAVTLASVLCSSFVVSLDLSWNCIGEASAEAIAAALEQSPCRLETLSLSINNIGAVGCAALADSMRRANFLSSLSLACCGIGDRGALAIANVLDAVPTLTHLDIATNGISKIGGNALAAKIAQSKSLASIVVEGNEFSVEPWREMLAANVTVNKLVGFEEDAPIQELLRRNALLRQDVFDAVTQGDVDRVRKLCPANAAAVPDILSLRDGLTVVHVAIDAKQFDCIEHVLACLGKKACKSLLLRTSGLAENRKCALDELNAHKRLVSARLQKRIDDTLSVTNTDPTVVAKLGKIFEEF